MCPFMSLYKSHNNIKCFVTKLHKFVLWQCSILNTIERSRYVTFKTVYIDFLSGVKCYSHEFIARKEFCSYVAEPNKVKPEPVKIKEYGTTNKNNDNDITKRIELIVSDILKLKRVSKSDVDTLHYIAKATGICSETQGVVLLQSCGRLLPDVHPKNRTELALSVWKTLRQCQNPLTLKHYSALLTSLADNKHPVSLKEMLLELQQDNLTMDASCRLCLLRCACEVGDMKQASDLLDLMSGCGVNTDQETLGYLILGHGRSGDIETVERLFASNEGSSTLTAVLKVSAEAGLAEMFNTYFRKVSVLSEIQRLEIAVCLAIGNLTQYIPKILGIGNWSYDGVTEASNTSIQLVHLGCAEAGVCLLKTLAQHTIYDETTFAMYFIEELLKCNTKVDTVIRICTELSEYQPRSLIKAAECSLMLQRQDVSLQLLKEMKKQGHTIRPHYFWPLIISASQSDGEGGILNILDTMLDMKVTPDFDTLRDYIFPRWKFTNIIDVVKDLRNIGLTLADLMTPALYYLLFNNRIQEAVELCSAYKARLDWNLLLGALARSFVISGNVTSTVALLSFANTSAPSILIQNIMSKRSKPVQHQQLDLLLKELKDKGYKLFTDQEIITDEVSSESDKLFFQSKRQNVLRPKDLNLEELECHLVELKAKRMNTRGVLRKLFQLHCRLGNLERAIEIKNELYKGGVTFSSGMVASLFQLYVSTEQVCEAEKCLQDLQQNHPDFKIDSYKIVDLARVLVNDKQYNKALTILRKYKGEDGSKVGRNCWRLLNTVGKVEGVDAAKETLKVLVAKNYSKVSGELLSPLINAHFERNDLNGAVEEFQYCYETYGKTPMLNSLLCRLSKLGESDLLEKVLSIGRKLHGVSNANIMYILALAENNLPSRMFKVLQSSNFEFDCDKLLAKCVRFVNEDNPRALENIVSSLRANSSINVEPFCHLILQLCIKHGNRDAASKLWTSMQESGTIPSAKFSDELQTLISKDK